MGILPRNIEGEEFPGGDMMCSGGLSPDGIVPEELDTMLFPYRLDLDLDHNCSRPVSSIHGRPCPMWTRSTGISRMGGIEDSGP